MTIITASTDPVRAGAAVLRPVGALDRSNFAELSAQAWAARDAGARYLIVDMSDVERVSTAGLVGLHAVALIAQGAAPRDHEAGWASIRALAEECCPIQPLALVNPRALVRQTLARVPFANFLVIHADLDAALAALAT
jgi:anti-anti-sigma regulatory factor